jgi:hypothetical protein
MSKLLQGFKWIGIALAVMVGALFVCQIIGGIRLYAQMVSLRDRGVPTSLEDLAKNTIPDSQNGAVIYEQIFAEMKKPEVARDIKIIDNIEYDKQTHDMPKAVRPQVAAALNNLRPLFDMLDIALSCPKCKFKRQFSRNELIFPYLSSMRRLSRLCLAQAVLATDEGRTRDAVHWIGIGYKASESLERGDFVIEHIVEDSLQRMASRSLEYVIDRVHIDDQNAKSLFDLMGGIDNSGAVSRCIKGERASILSYYSASTDLRFMVDDPDEKPTTYSRLLGASWHWFARNTDYLILLDGIAFQAKSGDLSYRDAKSRGLLDNNFQAPLYSIVAKGMLWIFPSVRRHRYVQECQTSFNRMILALVAYKERYGRYPKSIVELRNRLGWKLPTDPFGGADFKYRREGQGFILYSLGPNLKDDGGVQHETRVFARDETGDYVWKMAR